MKKTAGIISLVATFVLVGVVSAKSMMVQTDNADTAGENNSLRGQRQTMMDQRGQFKTDRVTFMANLQQEKADWKTKRQEFMDKFKSEKADFINKFKEKFTAERCARVNERVQERTTNFDSAGAKHTQVYTNLISRIDKFIARFDEAKLDTATIKSHEAELQTKIDKFKEDYAAYIAKLKETKTLTCGHAEGEFRGTLVDAKALLQTVHGDAADIRTFVRGTILPDLKALKEQMPKDEKAATDGDSDTTDNEQ